MFQSFVSAHTMCIHSWGILIYIDIIAMYIRSVNVSNEMEAKTKPFEVIKHDVCAAATASHSILCVPLNHEKMVVQRKVP
jgi:hypothetical protein